MTPEQEAERDMIREAARKQHGLELSDDEFRLGDDGVEARAGRWTAVEENDEIGLYEGDTGELIISIVGAPQYGNQRVAYHWQGDDFEEPSGEVLPFVEIQPQ